MQYELLQQNKTYVMYVGTTGILCSTLRINDLIFCNSKIEIYFWITENIYVYMFRKQWK